MSILSQNENRCIDDNLAVDYDMTVEELLNRYINDYYGPVKGKLVFLYNARQ